MDRIIDRLFFISVLFIILYLMHFYSFGRLASLFNIKRNVWYYLTVVTLASSLIFSTILCRVWFNPFTRVLYIVAACWFGVQFILFSAVLFYEIPRLLLPIKGTLGGTIIVSYVAIMTVASIINAQFIRVKEVEIPSFGKDINAVMLSDMHIGTIWRKSLVREIVDRTNALKPDVVFITGDILSGGAALREDDFAPLSDLEAKAYFINGNHERYEGTETIERLLGNNGIEVLNDRKVEFEGIEVIGVDYIEDGDRIASILKEMDLADEKPTILLTHAPINPENDKVDLILSGHTHAGQIFPFHLVVRSRYKYIKGLYTSGNTTIYVTPGTNTWGPPMRIGSRNEITLLKLR
jgi:predicted MPP superfamily phosphohydrolase